MKQSANAHKHLSNHAKQFDMPLGRTDISHDDVIKWKHFPRYWPFVREIHRSVTRRFDVSFDLRLNKRLS